jgi:iron complex outermembrane receptor protein
MIFQSRWLAGVAGLAAIPGAALGQPVAPATAANQTNAQAGRAGQIEDIIVTAQKREQNLQSVPISISAFTSASLSNLGVRDTLDIPNLVPGFVITKSLNVALPYLRGVGQSSATIGIESNVALYVDGVYLTEPAAGIFSLNNIARVEVLKGPQGTLFGRNATGGVVHVITKDPSWTPTVDMDVGYGNYQTFTGHFFGSTPITDTLAASIAIGGSDRRDGYGRNITLNQDIFQSQEYNVQGKLLWKPGDNTAVTLNLLYNYAKGFSGTALGIYPGSVAEDRRTTFIAPYTLASATSGESWTRHRMGSLKVEQDLGWARLVNIAALRREKETIAFTQNGIPNGLPPAVNARFPNEGAKTFTDELQMQSPSSSAVQWIVGLFYLHNNARLKSDAFLNTKPLFSVRTRQLTESYSGFAQVTAPILADTRLTLGARYTVDEKSVSGERRNGLGVVTQTFASALGALGQPTRKTWKRPTFRASLDHDLTPDMMAYASYNRGFKSGVYNLLSLTNPAANPEKLDAYEVGLKNTLFDRRLRINIAAFYYDYANIQLRSLVPPNPVPLLYNAAKARIKGIDLDFQAVPVDGLTLSGGFEILDADYTNFAGGACPVPAPTGGNPVTVACDLTGNRLLRAPKFSGNIGLQYVAELSDGGSVEFSASESYNSGYFFEPDNRLRQKSYHMVNASLRWNLAGGNYALQLWGKNLANEQVYANAAAASSDTYAPGVPRTYGATASIRF